MTGARRTADQAGRLRLHARRRERETPFEGLEARADVAAPGAGLRLVVEHVLDLRRDVLEAGAAQARLVCAEPGRDLLDRRLRRFPGHPFEEGFGRHALFGRGGLDDVALDEVPSGLLVQLVDLGFGLAKQLVEELLLHVRAQLVDRDLASVEHEGDLAAALRVGCRGGWGRRRPLRVEAERTAARHETDCQDGEQGPGGWPENGGSGESRSRRVGMHGGRVRDPH